MFSPLAIDQCSYNSPPISQWVRKLDWQVQSCVVTVMPLKYC